MGSLNIDYKLFVIDMIYESEHDPRSWINNLSILGEPWPLRWPDASLYP